MAGTPTTNYNIPTYADTDAPDLSGAYNDAMGIIDTQLKANADAIESASTGNYTGTAPITVDNEERTISVVTATPGEDGTTSAYGATRVSGKASDIGTGNALNGTTVPNCKAVADYVAAHGGTQYTAGYGINISDTTIANKVAGAVIGSNIADIESSGLPSSFRGGIIATANNPDAIDRLSAIDDEEHNWPGGSVPTVKALKGYVESKMAAAGAAYTGTAPVVVDNGSHTIRVKEVTSINQANIEEIETNGIDSNYSGTVRGIATLGTVIDRLAALNDEEHGWAGNACVSAGAVKEYVASRTPDASTSVKGLVRLTTSPSSSDASQAVTGQGLYTYLQSRRGVATQQVTVDMLKNLYVDSTGVVYYKAPSE